MCTLYLCLHGGFDGDGGSAEQRAGLLNLAQRHVALGRAHVRLSMQMGEGRGSENILHGTEIVKPKRNMREWQNIDGYEGGGSRGGGGVDGVPWRMRGRAAWHAARRSWPTDSSSLTSSAARDRQSSPTRSGPLSPGGRWQVAGWCGLDKGCGFL